jgi:hypothetical protein
MFAQAYEPTTDLDKPFNGPANSAFSLYMARGFFSTQSGGTIAKVISYLRNLNWNCDGSDDDWWDDSWVNQIGMTKEQSAALVREFFNDLDAYAQKFPAAGELLTSSTTIAANDFISFDETTGESKKGRLTSEYSDSINTSADDQYTSTTATGQKLLMYAGRSKSNAGDANSTNAYQPLCTERKSTATAQLTITTSARKYVIYAYDTTTPIVLDMDGDGKLEASKGNYLPHDLCIPMEEMVAFDINGDNFEELVEWIGPNDGLLVLPVQGEEVSGKHLFGSAKGFQNGFQCLSTLDANNDDVISGEELAGLCVWQDANRNGKVDAGEMNSVQSLGITKLNVKAIELTATFERNGKYYMMWDWCPSVIMVKKAK